MRIALLATALLTLVASAADARVVRLRIERHGCLLRCQCSRYTRRAVPLNIARFSSAEAPAAMRLSAFHRAAQPIPIGAHVLVIHYRGARQVDVEPWSPMPQDRDERKAYSCSIQPQVSGGSGSSVGTTTRVTS